MHILGFSITRNSVLGIRMHRIKPGSTHRFIKKCQFNPWSFDCILWEFSVSWNHWFLRINHWRSTRTIFKNWECLSADPVNHRKHISIKTAVWTLKEINDDNCSWSELHSWFLNMQFHSQLIKLWFPRKFS